MSKDLVNSSNGFLVEGGLGPLKEVVAYAAVNWDRLRWGFFEGRGRGNAAEQETIVGNILKAMNKTQSFWVSYPEPKRVGRDEIIENHDAGLEQLEKSGDIEFCKENNNMVSLTMPLLFRVAEIATHDQEAGAPRLLSTGCTPR